MEPKLNELSRVSQFAPGIKKDGWWKFNVRAKKKTAQKEELLLDSSFCLQSLPSSIGISLEAIEGDTNEEGDEPQVTDTKIQPAISSASTAGEHVPSPTIEVPQNYDDESTPSTTNHASQTAATAPPDPASPVSQNENAEATSQIAVEQSARSQIYTFTVTGVQRGVSDVPSVNESSQINYQLTGETARNLILDSSTSLRFYQQSRDVFKFENEVLHVVLPNELYEDVKEFRDKYDDLLARIRAIALDSGIPLSDLQTRVCSSLVSNLTLRKKVRSAKSTQQVLELLERFGNTVLNTEALDKLIEAFKGYDKVEELSAEKKAFSSKVHEFSKSLSMRLLHNCEIDWSQAHSVRCIVNDKEAVKGIMIDVCVLLNESFFVNAGIEATMDVPGLVKNCMGVIFSLHANAIGVGIVSYNLLEAVAPPTVAHDFGGGGGGGGEREERGGNEQGNINNKTADQRQDHQRQDPPRPPQDSTAQPSAKDSHSTTDHAEQTFVPPPPPPQFKCKNFTTESENATQGVKLSENVQFYNNTTKSDSEPNTENSNSTTGIVYASQTYASSRNSSNPQHNHTMPRRVLPKQPKVKKSFQYSENKEYKLIVQTIAIFLTTVLILFTVISTYCLFLSMLRFGAFLFWSRDDEYQQCFFHKKFMEWPSQLLDSLFFFVKKILRLLMWICVILLVYFILHTINQLSTSTWEKVFMLGLAVFALILITYALKDNIDFKLDQRLRNLLAIIKPVLKSIFPLAVILGCAYLLQILLKYDIDLRYVGAAVFAIIILIFILILLKPVLKSLYQIIANLSIPTYFHTAISNGIIILAMLVLWLIIGDQVFFIVGLVIAIVILPPILLFVGRVIKQVWESNLMLFVVTQLVGFFVLFFFIPLSNSGELYSWYIVTIVSFILGCNTTIIFFKAIGNLIAFIALMFSQLLYLPGLQTKQFNDFGTHLISIK